MFEIGNSLREARERRGVEFAHAEQVTKIRGKYLRALEEERFEVLPSVTYVKGFLRTYADYLGLDGQLYVDEYNSRFVTDDWMPRVQRSTLGQKRERRLQANVVLIAIAAIAVLTVVVISAWSSSGHSPTAPRAKHAARKPAVPAASLVIRAVLGPSKVIVHRTGAGGHVLFEGTLARGQTQSFSGHRFWVNIGAPENLVIKVGGKRVHAVGFRPWVLTVTPAGVHGHAA